MDKLLHQWQELLRAAIDDMKDNPKVSMLDTAFINVVEISSQLDAYLNMQEDYKDPDVFLFKRCDCCGQKNETSNLYQCEKCVNKIPDAQGGWHKVPLYKSSKSM